MSCGCTAPVLSMDNQCSSRGFGGSRAVGCFAVMLSYQTCHESIFSIRRKALVLLA